jgi:NAD(P)-dependent dehydrogenase (short-subunit alcohol dehydrogenase family)
VAADRPVAVVTGANRGIGREVVAQPAGHDPAVRAASEERQAR